MSPRLDAATVAAKQGDAIDSRYHPSAAVRRQLNKVFPTHWSFLLGEIALYSFLIALLSGTYLTFFFDPSLREVVYEGSYAPLRGVEMSAATTAPSSPAFRRTGWAFIGVLVATWAAPHAMSR